MKALFKQLTLALAGALILVSGIAAHADKATPASVAPAPTIHRLTWEPGGIIIDHIKKYQQWRLNGDRVVIDGPCISACTLVAGLLPAENVCVTPWAFLAFHSAFSENLMTGERTFASEATRLMWHLYSENVRDLLRRRGWNEGIENPELIYIEGAELLTIFRTCTPDEIAASTQTS